MTVHHFRIVVLGMQFFAAMAVMPARADIFVCVEDGAKVMRSEPCKGGLKPKAVYPSASPVSNAPASVSRAPNRTFRPQGGRLDSTTGRYRRIPGNSPQYAADESGDSVAPTVFPQRAPIGGSLAIGDGLNGTIFPGRQGGMIHGGPLSGTILPGPQGGIVLGGPAAGSIWPGEQGGMVLGGPMSGSIIPSHEGGMIHGGPFSGSILPPR